MESKGPIFIFRTYVLEGEADIKFSLSEMWNLLQDVVDLLPNNASVICKQMIDIKILDWCSVGPVFPHGEKVPLYPWLATLLVMLSR